MSALAGDLMGVSRETVQSMIGRRMQDHERKATALRVLLEYLEPMKPEHEAAVASLPWYRLLDENR